jgi:hypothetical protein
VVETRDQDKEDGEENRDGVPDPPDAPQDKTPSPGAEACPALGQGYDNNCRSKRAYGQKFHAGISPDGSAARRPGNREGQDEEGLKPVVS